MRKPHGVEKRISRCSEWCKHSRGSGNKELRLYWRQWIGRVMCDANPNVKLRESLLEVPR